MTELEILKIQNATLLADIKIIKTVALNVSDKIGLTSNGNIIEDVELSDIVSEIVPDLLSFATNGKGLIGKAKRFITGKEQQQNPLIEKFKEVQILFPLFTKYKDL